MYNPNKHIDQEEPVFNTETGEYEKPLEETQKDQYSKKNFKVFCDYFKAEAEKVGLYPEVGGVKDHTAFKKARQTYLPAQIKDIVKFFFTLEKSKENPTITACFSNHTRTLWNSKEMKFNKMNQ